MEGLGVAANVVAIVNLSAKVATLCVQYSTEVASARADIQRLHSQVDHLRNALRATQRLVEGSKGQSLFVSQELAGSFRECILHLQQLEKRLSPNPARTAMRRLGRRAWKWPFTSKEVYQVLSNLERYEKTILLGLQVDQTNALIDIHEGVKQLALCTTEDASIARKPHRIVPFPPDPDFVQRPAIWTWMKNQYSGPARRMALVGMGGFGKSQLAIQFAHQVHADKPGTSIFWVHGNSKATFEESYRTLADVLALPRRHDPEVNVLAIVRDWLQRDDISPWLMIVDNADDIEVFFLSKGSEGSTQTPLASYLPKTANGKILVTSRSLDAAEKLISSSRAIQRVPVMEEEQTLELFRKKLEGEIDEAAATDLVRALDCIPLAVNQAAAYINRRSPRVTTRSYLGDFRRSERRKDSLLRSDKGDLRRHDGVSNSIVVTWQVTFEQIKREQERAANLLSLMSRFQAQNIPESMLHGYEGDGMESGESDGARINDETDSDVGSGQGGFDDDIDVLRGYSLVTSIAAGVYEMHPLVQFCTRSWISEFGDPERWSRLFTQLAADHFPSGAFETWEDCQSLLPHVRPALTSRPREERGIRQRAELLTNVSRYMLMIGEYSQAEGLAGEAAHTRRDILGPSHPSTLTSMNNLASTFWNQGRWEEAEKLEVEVMETRKTKLGADHPSTLISMNNLAFTWHGQCRQEDALRLMQDCVYLRQKKLGRTHPDTQSSVEALQSWQASCFAVEDGSGS